MSDESSDQQLISFFVYAVLVYPAANYLISRRQWPQHWRILAAVTFLALVATCQILYENGDTGPNYYQLLNVRRGDPLDKLKRVHRKLSIDLHPDKTPDPAKRALFLKVEEAYEVLRKEETRGLYERLGAEGAKRAMKSAVDNSYLLTQMLVHYLSTAVTTFVMTISDTGGGSMALSFFALIMIAFLEALFVLELEVLPHWLFPYTTAFDLIALLRRLFPAFMHGTRTVLGALYVDETAYRVASLSSLSQSSRSAAVAVRKVLNDTTQALTVSFGITSGVEIDGDEEMDGLVCTALADVHRRLGRKGDTAAGATVASNAALLENSAKLRVRCRGSPGWDLLLQGSLFCAGRMLLSWLKPAST